MLAFGMCVPTLRCLMPVISTFAMADAMAKGVSRVRRFSR